MLDHKLRKLELIGFKTFARRTELLLPAGLTGIVGPNGSGKSNLADALRWALGEQSLQHIRSKKTEDVIFAGGSNRAPLGMAEVTLTLDNTSGWIPLDFSEVTLTRRAYRSGDNEYFINNARVRLRDIVDLRNRAGFGQSSYSVIGQGLVDSVLSQRPEERRSLFEEAAGIRHYQAKRDQTLDQLAAAQQNLLRVQDILSEIEPRLEGLRRQSERARQHAQLSEELRVLQIRWYAARFRQLQHQLSQAEGLAGEAQTALAHAAEEAQRIEAQARDVEAERSRVEQRLMEQNRTAAELQRRREQLEGQISLAKDKLGFMQQQGQDAQRELAELSTARELLQQQRQQLDLALAQVRLSSTKLAEDIQAAEEQAKAQLASARGAEQGLQQARQALANAVSTKNQHEREIAELGERRGDLGRQAQQHAEDVKRKQGLSKVLAEKQSALEAEQKQMRGEDERLSGQTEEARMAVTAAVAVLSQKQAELAELQRSHGELSTRLGLLEELQTNLEGLAEGTRALIRQGHPGIVKSVTEGVQVEAGYERAIVAALGHKLDAVLVDGEKAALSILAASDVNEATLLLDSETLMPAKALPGIDGARLAGSVVSDGSPAIQRLLAGTLMARNLQDALAAYQQGWRAVTIAGDVVDVDGTITRRGMAAGEAVLKRQKALEDLSQRVRTSQAAVDAGIVECEGLAVKTAKLKDSLEKLEEESRKHAALRQHKAAEIRDLAQQLDAAQAQVDWLSSLREQVEQQVAALDLRRTALTADLDQGAADAAACQAQVKKSEQELLALQEAGQTESERTSGLRLELGVARQRVQYLESQRGDIQQQLAGAERQLEARQRRVEEQAGVAGELGREIAGAETQLAKVDAQLLERERQLPPLREGLAALREQAEILRQRETAMREQQSELDKRGYRLSFDRERKQEELDSLASSVREELQLTLDILPEPRSDLPEPSKREVDALKTRLAGLGPINPGALEEFEEVAQRHEFLTTQKADLDGAAQHLRTVIRELEELTRQQFIETFERVSREFQRFFGLMFQGGEVQMFLTDPESVHTTGIEIMAQPPGKRLQALPLLSGGERALVASALLFAILAVKPVPFCLLDEVDAALDEANVKRFCQALKSLAELTQFLVITHNRETMAVAGALYGVSMSQDGISRLVSLRMPREDTWQDVEDVAEERVEIAG